MQDAVFIVILSPVIKFGGEVKLIWLAGSFSTRMERNMFVPRNLYPTFSFDCGETEMAASTFEINMNYDRVTQLTIPPSSFFESRNIRTFFRRIVTKSCPGVTLSQLDGEFDSIPFSANNSPYLLVVRRSVHLFWDVQPSTFWVIYCSSVSKISVKRCEVSSGQVSSLGSFLLGNRIPSTRVGIPWCGGP
jgi:hypothetical protein